MEARVLAALKDKLLRQNLFEEFCEEFTREMNRLRMEHRAGRVAAERELERIQQDVRRMIQAIKDVTSANPMIEPDCVSAVSHVV